MEEWLKVAKSLRVGQKTRISHNCGTSSSNTLSVVHDRKRYWAQCYSCKQSFGHGKGMISLAEIAEMRRQDNLSPTSVTLPNSIPMSHEDTPVEAREWLYKAGIRHHELSDYSITYNPATRRVVLPVYSRNKELIWVQQRRIFGGKELAKYLQPSAPREQVYFTSTVDFGYSVCVVCEDILSTIKVGRFVNAISMLGTNPTSAITRELANYQRVVIWFDDDNAGGRAANELRITVHALSRVTRIITVKDPKLIGHHKIKQILEDHLNDH